MSDQQRFGAHAQHSQLSRMHQIVLASSFTPARILRTGSLFYTGDPLRLQGYVDMTDAPKPYPGMEPRNR